MNIEEYLDDVIPSIVAEGKSEPDCWILYKTESQDRIVGPALAVVKNRESLYQIVPKIYEALPSIYGVTLSGYWFDDPTTVETRIIDDSLANPLCTCTKPDPYENSGYISKKQRNPKCPIHGKK